MKREAKQVIDALKKKHAEEVMKSSSLPPSLFMCLQIEALKTSHLTLSPASSSSRAAAGDPSSSHVLEVFAALPFLTSSVSSRGLLRMLQLSLPSWGKQEDASLN